MRFEWGGMNMIDMKAVCRNIVRDVGRLFIRNAWMVTDRLNAAGDNGEAMFSYICERRKNAVFVIRKDSPDYARLRRIGKVVPYGSIRYHILCAVATLNISSHLDIRCPNAKEVFLQHGVCENDIHEYINRLYSERFHIVASADREYEAFCDPAYLVPAERIWLTGLPRYDLLEDRREKKVFVCLTWRSQFDDPALTPQKQADRFVKSRYYEALSGLLHDEELKARLKEKGYKLCLRMHPAIIRFLDRLDVPGDVEVFRGSYRELFATGSLLITDYSSVGFDYGYLMKPVLYYQFDYEEAFNGSGHFIKRGYFHYDEDGFSEVCRDQASLRECVLSYLPTDFATKSEYRKRSETFFRYRDRQCRERVYRNLLRIMRETETPSAENAATRA